MSLAQQLAKLHSASKVYLSDWFYVKHEPKDENNILNSLQKHPAFNYLHNFYEDYAKNYLSDIVPIKFTDNPKARSKDLFFIGENVIKTGKAKFFFVCEGSLSESGKDDNKENIAKSSKKKDAKLSITVLANLWLLDNSEASKDKGTIDCFCKTWWPGGGYKNMRKKIEIDKDIAVNSYVTDAVRLQIKSKEGVTDPDRIKKIKEINEANEQVNRKLLYQEIEMLQPELVICVGNTAKDIVGMKYLKQNTKFHAVIFPRYHKKEDCYTELSDILKSI